MPSIELQVDHRYFRIDSADQELVGRWLVDCLMLYPINPATRVTLRVMPFFLPHPTDPSGQVQEVADWCCDSRKLEIWSAVSDTGPVGAARTLAGFLTRFADQLEAPEDARPEKP